MALLSDGVPSSATAAPHAITQPRALEYHIVLLHVWEKGLFTTNVEDREGLQRLEEAFRLPADSVALGTHAETTRYPAANSAGAPRSIAPMNSQVVVARIPKSDQHFAALSRSSRRRFRGLVTLSRPATTASWLICSDCMDCSFLRIAIADCTSTSLPRVAYELTTRGEKTGEVRG